MAIIENRPFGELKVGDSAALVRTLTNDDIQLFAVMSGDVNPAHVDPEFAESDMFHKVIAHGMWSATLISTVLGTLLPGPGTIYLAQSLRFLHPVGVGDTVTVLVTVAQLAPARHTVKLDCKVSNQHSKLVVTGVADVIAPTDKVRRERVALPDVEMHAHERDPRGDTHYAS